MTTERLRPVDSFNGFLGALEVLAQQGHGSIISGRLRRLASSRAWKLLLRLRGGRRFPGMVPQLPALPTTPGTQRNFRRIRSERAANAASMVCELAAYTTSNSTLPRNQTLLGRSLSSRASTHIRSEKVGLMSFRGVPKELTSTAVIFGSSPSVSGHRVMDCALAGPASPTTGMRPSTVTSAITGHNDSVVAGPTAPALQRGDVP